MVREGINSGSEWRMRDWYLGIYVDGCSDIVEAFVKQVLAATQTPGEAGMNWFQGTADAVRQFTWLFEVQKLPHKLCWIALLVSSLGFPHRPVV